MILQGDARALPLADGTVQCVVTSPPYWGLRDYGLPPSVWDAEATCAHVWGDEARSAQRTRNGNGSATLEGADGPIMLHPGTGVFCRSCPAWRGVLGLEPTPELYVAHLVAIFREVRRVLRADGTCWVNLGDSYSTSPPGIVADPFKTSSLNGINGAKHRADRTELRARNSDKRYPGLKPKDLVGIPWRVAFALQADGWYLRADIIWAKPNPMPESVTDRPTKAHEYLFLLAKAERYYYDAEAIKESAQLSSVARYAYAASDGRINKAGAYREMYDGTRDLGVQNGSRILPAVPADPSGRNRRSVWTIATEPYPEAHFATFPEALVAPCLLAGTSEAGACAACGAPWARMSEPTAEYAAFAAAERARKNGGMRSSTLETLGLTRGTSNRSVTASRATTGWRPTCACDAAPRPCVVLDPFGGSGTVGAVAERLGRRWVAVDLKPEYLALARRRTAQRGLPFLAAAPNGHGHHPQIEIAGTV